MDLQVVPIPSENKTKDKRLKDLRVENLPKLPTTCLILGAVGSGKSSCLYSMLTDGYVYGKSKRSVFDEMIVYLGNLESNYVFEKIKCKNKAVLNHFDPTAFEHYIANLKKHQMERLEKKKAPLNICIIFDDMAATSLLKREKGKDSNALEKLVLTSRHEANCSIFFLSQVYKNGGFSTPLVRANTMTHILYSMSRPEIEKIAEEMCCSLTPDQFLNVHQSIMKTPYSFMTIDSRRPLDSRIWCEFKYPIRKEDIEEAENM
jgi:hypothetical protein